MHLTQVGETRTETTSAGYPAPEIVEFYRDYIPPVDVKRTVEEMVASVPSKYLTGLKTILLTNSAALTRDQRRQKIFQRGRNHKLVEARGWYSRATRSRQASVAVIVNNTLGNLPLAMLRIPFFATFSLARFFSTRSGITSTLRTSLCMTAKRTSLKIGLVDWRCYT